ncbi:hypothetical protein QUF55_01130 [Clostridiaceae bacterium HSG29]|nr:hypothetical protein [Clostridiaceae bacterium HSG29]
MKYDFRKTGIKLLLFAIIFLILMSKLNVTLNIRLFFGTFSIGVAIFLIFFGKFNPDEDDEEEEM